MDAPTARPFSPNPSPSRRIPTWQVLTLILAVGLGLRLCTITRAEVSARDCLGFVRHALRFENEDTIQVLKTTEQPPGYPLALLFVSRPVRAWRGDSSSETMVLSAQL